MLLLLLMFFPFACGFRLPSILCSDIQIIISQKRERAIGVTVINYVPSLKKNCDLSLITLQKEKQQLTSEAIVATQGQEGCLQ
jgi:hypothetical protein